MIDQWLCQKRTLLRAAHRLIYLVSVLLPQFTGRADDAIQPGLTLEPRAFHGGSFHFEAKLRAIPSTVRVGDAIRIECEASGGAGNVYNPFLSEQYRLPAQIVILSADGKTRHELLRQTSPTHQSDARCWLFLRSGQSVGREFLVKTAIFSDDKKGERNWSNVVLPPGEYYVQAAYNRWFIANWPNSPGSAQSIRRNDGTGDEPQVERHLSVAQMNEPIAVSEAVKFTVIAPMIEKPGGSGQRDVALRLELRPSTTRVNVGRQTKVEIRLINQADITIDVFNPLLDSWLFSDQAALDLLISTADGVYLGNHMNLHAGHSRTPKLHDWVRMPPGATVSSMFSFWSGSVPGTRFLTPDALPPGKYFLQLVGHEPLLSSRPLIVNHTNDATQILRHPSYEDWKRTFPGPEICRSNRVELELLPRTGD